MKTIPTRLTRARGTAHAAVIAIGVGLAATLLLAADRPRESADPLETDLQRWLTYARDTSAADELTTEARRGSGPILERAAQNLREGRRLLALLRLAAVRANATAGVYAAGLPEAARTDLAAFEAEWHRMGTVLRDDLRPPSAREWEGVQPAAVRAIGEAARLQARGYYAASLDYARNTEPRYGLFYLGIAQGQLETARLCRTLSRPTGLQPPALRGLAREIESLQGDLLAAYRPPASIDRHPEFIAASAQLKEARELDAAGLRHGALLRYLYAAMRAAPLRASPPALDSAAVAERLADFERRCASSPNDHSIGQLFLEYARAEPAAAPAAIAIAADVMPRYFAALEPAPARAAAPSPAVTVTLVRWPYT